MKLLNGKELAGYIKERQARNVRRLKQSVGVSPVLAIIQCKDDPVINTYVKLKKAYGTDIGVGVDVHFISQDHIIPTLEKLNSDARVHGIIVQLPLVKPDETDEIVNRVAPEKDVDALGRSAAFDAATPMAILWLLSGHNIDLNGKQILLVGRGKLVGLPLEKILKNSEYNVETVDRGNDNLSEYTKSADVIITATGSPAIIYPDMLKHGAVVVDAGVASESGKTVGDLHESVYDRDDLTITPPKGGVGPLTVCALFENVIRAAERFAKSRTSH